MITILLIIVTVALVLLIREGRKTSPHDVLRTDTGSPIEQRSSSAQGDGEPVKGEGRKEEEGERNRVENQKPEEENRVESQKPEEEIERVETENGRQELSGKVVYQDEKRKMYFAEDGETPMLDYNGKTYSLSCHPYEPMLIIRHKGENVAYIHNAFYPDIEYKGLLKGQLVLSITGKYHNAERFARLLTTALDTGCDDISEVEMRMMEGLARDKGVENIEYGAYDFKCTKVLYEGVALVLGYFDVYTGERRKSRGERREDRSERREANGERSDERVYALGFGYPHNGTDMYEYYLISAEEYKEYMGWKEGRDWGSHEAAYEWHEAHLAGRQVLCNEFSHMKKSYKPYFYLRELRHEIPTAKRLLHIRYTRQSVCAQDDYVNREWSIVIKDDKTLADLMAFIREYHDDTGFTAIPYTGGEAWWHIKSGNDTLAEICEDDDQAIRYNRSPSTLLSQLGLHELHGVRKA